MEARVRSWNEKWFDRVGTSYMVGLGCGGVWGFHEGVRNPLGKTYRMRANSLLNGLTRRGPFMANTLAVLSKGFSTCFGAFSITISVLALVYSPLESALGHLRGKQDLGNSLISAAVTGALYKSTGRLENWG